MEEGPTTWVAFRSGIAARMTAEHPTTVERLRVDQELAWGGLAGDFDDEVPR